MSSNFDFRYLMIILIPWTHYVKCQLPLFMGTSFLDSMCIWRLCPVEAPLPTMVFGSSLTLNERNKCARHILNSVCCTAVT